MTSINRNYTKILSEIEKHARIVGRDPEDIKLVAVTKTVGIPEMEDLIECGVTDIGEARVQDALKKQDSLTKQVNWHFIGHLQTNKAKNVVGRFVLIHSVDSVRLARKINAEAEKVGCRQKILLEVKVSAEEAKYGFRPDEIGRDMETILHLDNIDVRGLMTMAPFTDDMARVRSCFRALNQLRQALTSRFGSKLNLEHLSMGMTNDYQVAVEEGATLVRVGSALFQLN